MLQTIVGSRGRTAIFRTFFTLGHKHLYLRELSRATALSAPVLQRELRPLVQAGILCSQVSGNRTEYFANLSHPLYPVLCELVDKTVGGEALLRTAFADCGAAFVFIFGSTAAGTATPQSDIDLFVIGDCGLRDVARRIHSLSDTLSQEVNPYVITMEDFLNRKDHHDHFLMEVLAKPKIFLKGSADEFARMAGQRVAPSA